MPSTSGRPRCWTYVSDTCGDGLVAAVDRPLGFEISNLSRGDLLSLANFINELQASAGWDRQSRRSSET